MNDPVAVEASPGSVCRSNAAQGLEFARFLELRGRRVVEKFGVLWHSVRDGLYMSLPYHRRLDLDPLEAAEDLPSMGAAGIRYPSLTWGGLPSGLYVCRQRGYCISSLHRNFRSHVRHGMPLCEVRRLTEHELAETALRINVDAMRRQGRYDPEFGDVKQWRRFAHAVQECPCITPVGAFVDGRLASYAITCLEDGWLHILYKMTDMQMDGSHPSQVLDFTITCQALSDPTVTAASMGWAPLVPIPGLHQYKARLGYDCEPQWSVIQLRPTLHWALTGRAGRIALSMARLLAGKSQTLGTALAMADGARLTRETAEFIMALRATKGDENTPGTTACLRGRLGTERRPPESVSSAERHQPATGGETNGRN